MQGRVRAAVVARPAPGLGAEPGSRTSRAEAGVGNWPTYQRVDACAG
jgi:hypothetical protein